MPITRENDFHEFKNNAAADIIRGKIRLFSL